MSEYLTHDRDRGFQAEQAEQQPAKRRSPVRRGPNDRQELHPIYVRLRQLRNARGWSLAQLERRHPDWNQIVVGSYERGDRRATVEVVDRLLQVYGCKLAVIPVDPTERELTLDERTDLALAQLQHCLDQIRQIETERRALDEKVRLPNPPAGRTGLDRLAGQLGGVGLVGN